MEGLLRRLDSLRTDRIALVGTVAAAALVALAAVLALTTGPYRLSAVAAVLTFLLAVAAGLYASRLGAPGRSD